MTTTITGVVTNGRVIPNRPLPEGAFVEIQVRNEPLDVPPALMEEMMAWQQGSAEALALVERLADQEGADETR